MTLNELYIELDAIEIAMDNAMSRLEYADLDERRAEVLGEIKQLERKENQ